LPKLPLRQVLRSSHTSSVRGEASRAVTRHDGSIFAIGEASRAVTRHDGSIFAIGEASRAVTRHDGSIFAIGDGTVRCTSCSLLPRRCPRRRGNAPIASITLRKRRRLPADVVYRVTVRGPRTPPRVRSRLPPTLATCIRAPHLGLGWCPSRERGRSVVGARHSGAPRARGPVRRDFQARPASDANQRVAGARVEGSGGDRRSAAAPPAAPEAERLLPICHGGDRTRPRPRVARRRRQE